MTQFEKPATRPARPTFSSGPCTKFPGWSLEALKDFHPGRSHRASGEVKKLEAVIERSRKVLGIPDDYKIAVTPASDTGAFEMALWNLLGPRGVDVMAWEVFGKIWVVDIVAELRIRDVRVFEADFGMLPDLSQIDTDRDVVFTWNGTTSGVRVPDGGWIRDDRKGLTICDATSALFSMEIPWQKLDAVTWSWQKVLGSEGGHGMIALSPRAVQRLESYKPEHPLPKLFRISKKGKVSPDPFVGKTINTPSMLAVEDCLAALDWAEQIGGLAAMQKRSDDNLAAVAAWVAGKDWIDFLPEEEATRSNTSICLKLTDPWFLNRPPEDHWPIVKSVEKLLGEEGVAYDFANHRDSVPGFRFWGGATVEQADIESALEWLDWGYRTVRAQYEQEAA